MSTRCKTASVKVSTSFNCASVKVINRMKILTLMDTFSISSCLISPLLSAVGPTSLLSPSYRLKKLLNEKMCPVMSRSPAGSAAPALVCFANLLKSEILEADSPDALAHLVDLILFSLAIAAMTSKTSMGRSIL